METVAETGGMWPHAQGLLEPQKLEEVGRKKPPPEPVGEEFVVLSYRCPRTHTQRVSVC